MTKVFISQPMNGMEEKEILHTRNETISFLKTAYGNDIEILDSYFNNYIADGGCAPLKYLAKSLEIMANADVACFVEGWQNARGCKIERECAEKYNIPIFEVANTND